MNVEKNKSDTPATPPVVYYPPMPPLEEDEINLMDLWRVLVRYKATIIASIVMGTTIAVAAALLMTPVYRAEVVMAPVDEKKSGGLSALMGQFGGLAAMAGINIGGGGGKMEEAIAKLKSRSFTDAFIKDHKLMPVLFADIWDEQGKRWLVDAEEDIPTLWDAYKKFDDIRNVSTDKKTGIVTLSIEWQDPELAAQWANILVERINRQLQQEAIAEAKKSIAYLEQQLDQTSVIEMRQAIFRLIEAQTKQIMLANVRDEFAFKVIDQAVPPEERIKPKRKVMVVVGFMVGLMLGILLAFLRNFIAKQREEAQQATEVVTGEPS